MGGVWADWTTPDWLMESERDWMAVSDTVVQILGEPCRLSLLRSSTWWTRRERRREWTAEAPRRPDRPLGPAHYLASPGGLVVGLQVLVVVVELRLLLLLLLLQGHQVGVLLLQLPLQPLRLTLLLQLLALVLLTRQTRNTEASVHLVWLGMKCRTVK